MHLYQNIFSTQKGCSQLSAKNTPALETFSEGNLFRVRRSYQMFFFESTLFSHNPLHLFVITIPDEPPCWIKKEGLGPIRPLLTRSQKTQSTPYLTFSFIYNTMFKFTPPHITPTPSDGKLQLITQTKLQFSLTLF
jgi:hypothetical protein